MHVWSPNLLPVLPGLLLETNFVQFYIMHNGTDSKTCGKSMDSACLSLLHVLMLYFAEPPTVGLEIWTDKSLLVNNDLMVFHYFVHFRTKT